MQRSGASHQVCQLQRVQVWTGKKQYTLHDQVKTKTFSCSICTLTKQSSWLSFHFGYFVNSCMQYTDAGLYTCSTGGRPHKIPGSYGHYDQDAKTYADWGIECKLDTQYCINTLWVYTRLLCHFAHYRCKNGLVQYKGRWKTAWSKRTVPSNGKINVSYLSVCCYD